jgi:hypothetical protein
MPDSTKVPLSSFFSDIILSPKIIQVYGHKKMEKDSKNDKKKKMLYHAYRCLLFKEMLIEQSDRWLSEEEGNDNIMKQIKTKKKANNEHING